MEANIKLVSYTDEKEILRELIKKFWLAHNDYVQSDEEAMEDLCAWTSAQNKIYLIKIAVRKCVSSILFKKRNRNNAASYIKVIGRVTE